MVAYAPSMLWSNLNEDQLGVRRSFWNKQLSVNKAANLLGNSLLVSRPQSLAEMCHSQDWSRTIVVPKLTTWQRVGPNWERQLDG